jgi:hypothetical protein
MKTDIKDNWVRLAQGRVVFRECWMKVSIPCKAGNFLTRRETIGLSSRSQPRDISLKELGYENAVTYFRVLFRHSPWEVKRYQEITSQDGASHIQFSGINGWGNMHKVPNCRNCDLNVVGPS